MSRLTDLENQEISPWGNKDNALVNPNTQASAAGTNTFTYPVTVVSGTAAMVDITVPYPSFQGRITLLPTGAFTWTAAGNIAVLGTAVVARLLDFYYNPITGKWYPSYV
jgi:hypothetical protein